MITADWRADGSPCGSDVARANINAAAYAGACLNGVLYIGEKLKIFNA